MRKVGRVCDIKTKGDYFDFEGGYWKEGLGRRETGAQWGRGQGTRPSNKYVKSIT